MQLNLVIAVEELPRIETLPLFEFDEDKKKWEEKALSWEELEKICEFFWKNGFRKPNEIGISNDRQPEGEVVNINFDKKSFSGTFPETNRINYRNIYALIFDRDVEGKLRGVFYISSNYIAFQSVMEVASARTLPSMTKLRNEINEILRKYGLYFRGLPSKPVIYKKFSKPSLKEIEKFVETIEYIFKNELPLFQG
jgi:hypothetical protein